MVRISSNSAQGISKFNIEFMTSPALFLFSYCIRCVHCQRLEATFEATAKALHALHAEPSRNKGRLVKVAKINGSSERALASRFNIRGFPSIFLVDGWEVRQFDGQRTVSSIDCLSFQYYNRREDNRRG